MRIIPVVNQKGGPGKTTLTVTLADALAQHSRVAVVDIDPQGSSAFWADQIERAGHKLAFDIFSDTDPATLSRMRELPYDVVLVDCPGHLEFTKVINAVLSVSDFVLVPTEPDALGFEPLQKTIEQFVHPSKVPFRVVVTRVDPRVLGDAEAMKELLDARGWPYLRSIIRSYKAHKQAPLQGLLPHQYPGADRKAADDIRSVALELTSIFANAGGDSR